MIHFPWQIPTPLARISTNETLIRNLFLTLEDTAESAVKAKTAQQNSLNSLAISVLNNRRALDYLLAE